MAHWSLNFPCGLAWCLTQPGERGIARDGKHTCTVHSRCDEQFPHLRNGIVNRVAGAHCVWARGHLCRVPGGLG